MHAHTEHVELATQILSESCPAARARDVHPSALRCDCL